MRVISVGEFASAIAVGQVAYIGGMPLASMAGSTPPPAVTMGLMGSTTARAISTPAGKRQREMAWRAEHASFLMERYEGQWVVVEGERVIAAATTPGVAIAEARRAGVLVPYVFHVSRPEPGVSILGL
jgi:hypothetical protein